MEKRNKCSTCLSSDRKLNKLGRYEKIFNLLISDFRDSFTIPIKDVAACWECMAVLKKVTRFIQSVWRAQCSLKQCKSLSNLQTNVVNILDEETKEFQTDTCRLVTLSLDVKEKIIDNIKEPSCLQDLDDKIGVENIIATVDVKQCEDFEWWDAEDIKTEEDLPIARLKRQHCRKRRAKMADERQYNARNAASKVKKSRRKGKSELDHSDKFVFGRMSEEEMWVARDEYARRDLFVNWKFKCHKCLVLLHNQEKVDAHMKKHEYRADLEKCHVCEVYLPPAKLHVHRLTHYYKYACLLCDASVPFESRGMWKHYWDVHATCKTLKCPQCPDTFKSMYLYKDHIRTTHQAKMKCKKCGMAFVTESNYKKHIKLHEDRPVYRCDVCERTYKTRASLNSHKRVHDATKPGDAYCAECGLGFKCVARYKAHLKASLKHTTKDDPTFICDCCGKEFLKKHLLSTHIKRVHLTKDYVCSFCDKVYKKAVSLRQHVAEIHEGKSAPRDKVCDICGKGFKIQAILDNHKRTHTGERPFQCPFCSLTFGHKSVLYMHKKLVHKVNANRMPSKGNT